MSVQSISAIAGGLPGDALTRQPGIPQQQVIREQPETVLNTAEKIGIDELQKAVNAANEMFSYVRPDIKFVIDESTKDVVIMLIEPETGDVINRYPTEQALAISNAIVESQARAAEQHEAFRSANEQLLGLFVEQKT